jgi:hypothetical protein
MQIISSLCLPATPATLLNMKFLMHFHSDVRRDFYGDEDSFRCLLGYDRVQNGSGAHPDSYRKVTGGSFPGSKAAGARS